MDYDIWEAMSEDTRNAELAERLGIPVEDLQSVHRSDTTVTLIFNMQNSRVHSRKTPQYQDVGDDGNFGELYGCHPPQLEPDPYLGPYWPDEYTKEFDRAKALSYKPIPDAPPAYKDLPWKDLLDPTHRITIEEFLVYFPNHVARWPGLAANLRWTNLDRLFYRAARIINLARGSHQTLKREDQHTEVLPFQMKMERAIREVQEGYQLFDFPHENVTQDEMNTILRMRPRGQTEQQDDICTIREAAGYVTGINEFETHSPFSQYMKQFRPTVHRRRPPPMPEYTGGLGSLNVYMDYQAAAGDNFAGWPVQSMSSSATAVNSQSKNDVPLGYCQDPDCDELECDGVHSTATAGQDQTWTEDQRVLFAGEEPASTWDRDQPIVFVNDNATSARNQNNNAAQPAQACREGAACLDQHCTSSHPGPWTIRDAQSNHPTFQGRCNQQARCTYPRCNRSHGSWAWMYGNKGPVDNTNGTNGEVHSAHWQTPCSFEDGCRRATCAFGHPGPRTAPDVVLDFVTLGRCPFDRNCTDVECGRAHSSSASGGGERGGRGGRGGQRGGQHGGQRGEGQQRSSGNRGRDSSDGGGPRSRNASPQGDNVPKGPRNNGGRGRGRRRAR